MPETGTSAYAARLMQVQGAPWKRYAPNPYQWYLQHANLGFTLDVGAGIGRSLGYLHGNGVGVDHNPDAVRQCRALGFTAFSPEDFRASGFAKLGRFDSLLSSHVLEHLELDDARNLLQTYLPYVRPGGRVLLITPQERGHRSDDTHRTFLDTAALARLSTEAGLLVQRQRSFPLPRRAGAWFIYNEFIVESIVPAGRPR